MSRSLSLLVFVFVGGLFLAGCDDASTPTTPTPPPAPPPVVTPPPPPPPAAPAALASVTLNPATVNSQSTSEGTVTLTAPAPAGNAVVSLVSGTVDAARVPSSVTIPAGSTSATFRIETSTVPAMAVVTIAATYEGVTMSTQLTVLTPTLDPRFTVVSTARGEDACDIIDSAGGLECQFNASGSSGFVARYLWTMRIRDTEFAFTAPDNQAAVTPTTNCGFLGNGTSQDGRISMDVTLQLEDRSGNRSGTVRRTIAVFHNGRCGY